MFHRTNFGKLIISKNHNKYLTYNNLRIILVNGNDNELNIRHTIHKLIINGNNNKIEVYSSGKIEHVILRGNINRIISRYSLNISDYGQGNKEIIQKNGINIEEQEEEENSSLETQPQRYVLDWENEDLNNENEEEENEEEEIEGEEGEEEEKCIEGEENIEKNNINFLQIVEVINNINILIQNTELFVNSVKQILQNNLNSKLENILSTLIDISFTKNNINNNNEKCSICYENFFEGEKIKMTSCFHMFHFSCIKKWIQMKIESPDCPICRREI
jgi:hypothetical protein